MKVIVSILLFFMMINFTHAQEASTIPNNRVVHVKSWIKASLLLPKDFWNDSKAEEVIGQIGEEEFNKVKQFSNSDKIPQQFYYPYVMLELKKDTVFYQQRNSKLKAYKIASYRHYWGGKFWGIYSILRVSYNENKDWDSTAKWDTVYFIIPEKYLQEAG